MDILALVSLLFTVLVSLASLKMWVDSNELKKENKMLKRDLSEALNLYSALVRQIKEKNLK